ncbi:MAG TPA: hypothetical protein DHN29_05765 [Cytophagales bacterium]|nr:hypothetical protein [Cytophagales bacterium]
MIDDFFYEQFPFINEELEQHPEASVPLQIRTRLDQALAHDNPIVSAYDWLKFEFDDSDKVDKETWDEMYSRQDTHWFNGMTHYQAEIVRDERDYNARTQRIFDSVDGWNAEQLGAYFLGSLIDPLNFLPWTGFLAKSAKMVGIGKSAMQSSLMATRSSGRIISDAVLGSTIGELAIGGKRTSFQMDYDLSMAAINIVMAGGAGALLAGFGKVAKKLSKQSDTENLAQAGKATDDLAVDQPVEVEGSAFSGIKKGSEQLMNEEIPKIKQIVKAEGALLAEQPEVKIAVAKGTKIIERGKKEVTAIQEFLNCKMGA